MFDYSDFSEYSESGKKSSKMCKMLLWILLSVFLGFAVFLGLTVFFGLKFFGHHTISVESQNLDVNSLPFERTEEELDDQEKDEEGFVEPGVDSEVHHEPAILSLSSNGTLTKLIEDFHVVIVRYFNRELDIVWGPIFLQLGDEFANDKNTRIGEVNCSEHRDICAMNGVYFHHLKDGSVVHIYTNGKVDVYTGIPSMKEVNDFVANLTNAPFVKNTSQIASFRTLKELENAQKAYQAVLVKYFDPMCIHCAKMAPAYEAVGRTYEPSAASTSTATATAKASRDGDGDVPIAYKPIAHTHTPSAAASTSTSTATARASRDGGMDVLIAEVDCLQHIAMCYAGNIRGFPTLLLYINGSVKEYRGNRETEDIVTFVEENVRKYALDKEQEEKEGKQEEGKDKVDGKGEGEREKKIEEQMPTKDAGDDDDNRPLSAGDVAVLTPDNFAENIVSDKIVVVNFHSPGCRYCILFAPTYEQFAKSMEEDPSVVVASLDCNQYAELCQDNGVVAYPTTKIFYRGTVVAVFLGKRSVEDLKRAVGDVRDHPV